jgi:hypothetical protein
LTRIADSLTKQTGQLVDLAKLQQKVESPEKKKPEKSEDDLDDGDVDEIYSVLEEVQN